MIPFSGRGGLTAIDLCAESKPTIVYQPEQGQDFNSQLLSRISTETLDLLASKGWAADLVLRVTIRIMNDVDNATSAGGPTPYVKPEYERFRHVAYLVRELQMRRDVELAYEMEVDEPKRVSDPVAAERISGEDIINAAERGFRFQEFGGGLALYTAPKPAPVMVLRVAPQARSSPEMLAIAAILELEPGREYYRFELNTLGQLKKPSASRGGPLPFRLHEEIPAPGKPSAAACPKLGCAKRSA